MVASAAMTDDQRLRPAGIVLRLVFGFLILAPLAAAESEELALPAGFAGLNLSLDQISGKVNSYLGYEGFSYTGRDLLTGSNGEMSFVYGRNTPCWTRPARNSSRPRRPTMPTPGRSSWPAIRSRPRGCGTPLT